MPDQSGRSSSRDFAFQSTDQAFTHDLGGVDTARTSRFPPQGHAHYDVEQHTSDSNAPAVPNHTAGNTSNAPLSYPDFGAHQSSLPPQAQGDFANYGFSPGGALAWDWNSALEFPEFTTNYEPQGELVQELQNQPGPSNDFSIPLPVTKVDATFSPPQPLPSAVSTGAQNPLSPPPKPPQRPAVQTGVKRKAESEPSSAVSQPISSTELQQGPSKRPNKSRSSSSASITSPAITSTNEARRSSMTQANASTAAPEIPAPPSTITNSETQRKKEQSKGTGPQGRVIDVSKPRKIVEVPGGHDMLPAGKVFPIQIGPELFRLSGASLSSDAPSYFTHFFGGQLHANAGRAGDLRTLYIDRDPETFRDIALHLQGYHVSPRDGEHFVKLFADSQFYSLPRLTKQLFSADIFIRIGSSPFRISRELFSASGDSPNFFTLGFAQFFATPNEAFPGLDRNALLRPPSISPPKVPNRSGETFAELIRLLQGYNVEIRNETHRSQLLRDARYFHLKGLEQRLIPCEISFNMKQNQSEILIRLEDIRQSGVSFTPDGTNSHSSSGSGSTMSNSGVSPAASISKPASPSPAALGTTQRSGLVSYARPYTDDHANTNVLVLEVTASEQTTLHLPVSPPTVPSNGQLPSLELRATFTGTTLARITSLFSVIASKMGLPATQPLGLMLLQSGGGVAAQPVSPANSGVSERRVRVRLSSCAYIEIDGSPVEVGVDPDRRRVGIKRTDAARGRKRPRMSEGAYDSDEDSVASKRDWLWGGPRAEDVVMKDNEEQEEEWVIKRAHWKIRVEPVEGEGGKMQVVLCGVRIEGFSKERSRNRSRGFLSS